MKQSTCFTVREILSLQVLRKAQVLAGKHGLDRQVINMTVLDAPDAVNWVKGHEIVVTTLYPFREIEAQEQLVRVLAQKGAAAIGIKLKRYIDIIDDNVLKVADDYSIPIISIPYECAWIDLINPIMAEILNRQLVKLQLSERIHKSFTEEVLKDGQLNSIAKTLYNLVKKPITIADFQFLTCNNYPHNNLHPSNEQLIKDMINSKDILDTNSRQVNGVQRILKENMGDFTLVPILIAKKPQGCILIWGTGKLNESELIAVEHAATVSALQIQKMKAISETSRRFKDDLINVLLSKSQSTQYNVRKRAQELGWKLGSNNIVITVELPHDNSTQVWNKVQEVYDYVRQYTLKNGLTSVPLGVDHNGRVVLIKSWDVNEDGNYSASDIANNLKKYLSETSLGKIGIGIGSQKQEISTIPNSYEEACIASKVAMISEESCVEEYQNLGVYRLLQQLTRFREAKIFLEKYLLPIKEFDKKNKSDLLKTVDVFVTNDRNYRKTAKILYVHHNTIRYRVNLIESVCGVSLSNTKDVLNMHIALLLDKLMDN